VRLWFPCLHFVTVSETSEQAANPERLELEELTALQPGLARFMPEIGARFWKCYYAAAGGSWAMARWQLSELRKLMRMCMITRPKYTADLQEWIADDLEPLMAAIAAQDLATFQRIYHEAVDAANEFHRRWKKEFIVWKLPEAPPPDLDLTSHS
jgi:hypothetical protein